MASRGVDNRITLASGVYFLQVPDCNVCKVTCASHGVYLHLSEGQRRQKVIHEDHLGAVVRPVLGWLLAVLHITFHPEFGVKRR